MRKKIILKLFYSELRKRNEEKNGRQIFSEKLLKIRPPRENPVTLDE